MALARAALHGAGKTQAIVSINRACDVGSKHLLSLDAVLFCFAEMNASMAGEMKALFDRVYYPLSAQQKVLPCAVCMSVGNDGSGALRQFERIATGLSLKPISEPLVIKGEADEQQLQAVSDVAEALAEGALMGIF